MVRLNANDLKNIDVFLNDYSKGLEEVKKKAIDEIRVKIAETLEGFSI